jgi:hypothetical protein
MSLHHVRIQFDAEPWLVGYADVPTLDIWTVEQQDFVHPTPLTRYRFTTDIVTDGCSPLAVSPGVQWATGIVRRLLKKKDKTGKR